MIVKKDLVSLVGMKITQTATYGLALAGIASCTMPPTRMKFMLALTLLSLLVTSGSQQTQDPHLPQLAPW